MPDRTCTREGCTRPHYAHGVCSTHYRADRRAAGIDAKRSRAAITKTCECCGRTFTADREEARYCDRVCRDIANLLTGQQAKASTRGVAARPSAQPPKPYEQKPTCDVAYGTCPECNTPWSGPAWAGKVYCSQTCKWRAKARRNPRLRGYRKHAPAVFERDGYICWLCDLPTSSEWTANDPLAPTLDHIIPQALGGTDDADNLGCAHAHCNSRRGARLISALNLAT